MKDKILMDEKLYAQHFMVKALTLAKKAFDEGEVPIGVVIVQNGKVVARAYNKRNKEKNALYHAELLAISKACKKLGDWRLSDCDMFVTVVPCPMCAGAIVNSRLKKVYYGATNENQQLFDDIISKSDLNHSLSAQVGVMDRECGFLMKEFFALKR